MSLKLKFLLIFVTISTIPVIIITAYTYNRYTRLVQEQTMLNATTIFDKAVSESNATLDDIRNIGMTFNFHTENTPSIINRLKKFSLSGTGYSPYDILDANRSINFICRNFIFQHDYINGIFIFTPSGPVLGYGMGVDVNANYNPFADTWYEKTLDLEGGLYVDGISRKDFLLRSQPSISFSQALYDIYSHEFLGILYIDCDPSLFDLTAINTLPQMSLLYLDYNLHNILYTNVDTVGYSFLKDDSYAQSAILNISSFRLSYYVNFNALYDEFGVTRIVILAVGGGCLFVFGLISIFLSISVSKPIIHLSRKMAIKTDEQLQTSNRYLNRSDEIGILYNEYNHMIAALEEYSQREFKNKLITLDAQMKSLEAQINSHFLYNTLESINSLAELHEVESISVMSMALGDMFRYSIKTKSELVTLEEEMKHVTNYVSIQQIRFENRFTFAVEIPHPLYSLKVLKLLLQPLVENAFYHGLNYCRSGDCITIRAFRTEYMLYISVSDNGKGMCLEQRLALEQQLENPPKFTELGHRNNQSIGISNIHARIRLYYGEEYGIHIESQENQGTTMTLHLPLR